MEYIYCSSVACDRTPVVTGIIQGAGDVQRTLPIRSVAHIGMPPTAPPPFSENWAGEPTNAENAVTGAAALSQS